jgi:hypothetical protein
MLTGICLKKRLTIQVNPKLLLTYFIGDKNEVKNH